MPFIIQTQPIMRRSRTVFFLCSPSSAIIDNWMPILSIYRKKHPHFKYICIFPKSYNALQIEKHELMGNFLTENFDSFLSLNRSGLILHSNTLDEIQNLSRQSKLYRFIYLKLDQIERYLGIEILKKIFNFTIKIKDRISLRKSIFNIQNLDAVDPLVFFDIAEETKKYNEVFINFLKDAYFFSICHGINIHTGPFSKIKPILKREKIKVFLFSEKEIDFYKSCYCLDTENLIVSGIPRHENSWRDHILNMSDNSKIFSDNILIISRPVSDFLPYERKLESVKHLKKILIEDLKLKLTVKLHPKELDDGLFDKVLGTENLNITWQKTREHIYSVGTKSKFAITFYSGVCTDLTFINVPTIEYLDLKGLQKFDTPDAIRSDDGDPVFSYRYWKLVYGVSNIESLKETINYISLNKAEAAQKLEATYNKLFPCKENKINSIVETIDSCL